MWLVRWLPSTGAKRYLAYRAITGNPCPKTAADTFRLAPWQADDLRIPLHEKLVQDALMRREAAHQKPILFLSLDDSLTDKDKGSKRLQAVDWHFDHVNALPNLLLPKGSSMSCCG